jgi:hypothetical protein
VEALSAADAFFGGDTPDVSVFNIDVEGLRRAGLDAMGIDTLTALCQIYVMGKLFKRVLHHLNSGEIGADAAVVHQGAGEHAGLAALAFLYIDEQVSLGRREGGHAVIEPGNLGKKDAHPRADGGDAGQRQKITPG